MKTIFKVLLLDQEKRREDMRNNIYLDEPSMVKRDVEFYVTTEKEISGEVNSYSGVYEKPTTECKLEISHSTSRRVYDLVVVGNNFLMGSYRTEAIDPQMIGQTLIVGDWESAEFGVTFRYTNQGFVLENFCTRADLPKKVLGLILEKIKSE